MLFGESARLYLSLFKIEKVGLILIKTDDNDDH